MPVSLVLRGLHTDDDEARQAWQASLVVLHEADRVFSTYRDDSFVSRLGRGELTVADCPPEVAEVLAIGERARADSHGAFDVRRPGPDGARVLDPSGVVKGWAVQRAAAPLRPSPAPTSASRRAATWSATSQTPNGRAWSIGVEDPLDPLRCWPSCRYDAVRSRRRAAHRGDARVDARTGRPPRASRR